MAEVLSSALGDSRMTYIKLTGILFPFEMEKYNSLHTGYTITYVHVYLLRIALLYECALFRQVLVLCSDFISFTAFSDCFIRCCCISYGFVFYS